VTSRRGSLALRISLLAVAVAVITALIGGLIAVHLVRQATESGARQTLSRLADEVQSEAAATPVRTLTAVRALKVDSGVIGPRGRVQGTSALARDALTPGQIQAVLGGNPVSAVQTVDGESVLVEARPTANGGIVMVQPQAEAVAAGQVAVRRLTLALLIASGIAVALGLVVSWRLAQPLKRTAAAAHSLAAGERDVVVRPEGPVEVAEVAEALNSLGSGLARSEARQRDFLLSVSHDLRTPLTAIRGYAESLADGMIDPDQVPKAGTVILAEAQRLDRFVADLLDLARLDAREVRVDVADVDVVQVIEGAASVWTARCAGEGVLLTVECPAHELWVRTDGARLRQVLDGLLENALRVVPPGRPIVVASRCEVGPGGQSVVVFEVRDGGPGLTEADLAVAFDRSALYERYKGVRKVGTGLGLAIVHQLVRRMGGTVEAGHAPEGGARFTVRLPAGSAPEAPLAT
jgi:two-component system sensor histidine kinase BaeS